ncbi:type II toxin-antitoxin system VapC family toxin [Thomasclavelia cocleata]|uniref:type II toxin-antitoxin system VapC family toxin n=1 Tax=Thomasclavelia cocleata TaxID=69824 RepID=UPI00258C751D|nr:type II toxin-antitoxin system VapC family toxin [Thomasclavelia cocleata]
MKVLIDTHIAIWAVLNNPKLPKQAKDIILDKENDLFYSTASVWEITIKHILHPDRLRINGSLLEKGCEENGYFVLPILNKHVSALETLKRLENAPRHNDPFDKIMIAQAKTEGLMFLTHDSLIPYYNEPFIIPV